jgi:hypothetical protein
MQTLFTSLDGPARPGQRPRPRARGEHTGASPERRRLHARQGPDLR